MGIHIRFADERANGDAVGSGEGVESLACEEVMKYVFAKYEGKYLLAHEIGKINKNPHYHLYVGTNATADAVRNNLNNNCPAFKALARSQKYVKSWGDENKDLQYFVKDGNIRRHRGFSFKQIEDLLAASKQFVVERKVERASREPPVRQLYDRCMAKGLTSMPDVVDEALEMVLAEWKGINEFAIVGRCRAVHAKINGDRGREELRPVSLLPRT